MTQSVRDRIDESTVFSADGCRLWCGAVDRDGYAHICVGSRTDGTRRRMLVHRLAWELERGPIPDGLVIDHKCRVHGCCRVDHLRVVTRRVNATENSRGESAKNIAKAACPKCGGPYFVDSRGDRRCSPCTAAARSAAWKRRASRVLAEQRAKRLADPEAARLRDREYYAARRDARKGE